MRKLLLLAVLLLASIRSGAAPKTETLPFSEAYKQIMSRSLRVETQRLELRASEERRLRQQGAFGPNLSLDASQTRTYGPNAGVDPLRADINSSAFSSASTGTSLGVNASVNVYRGGSDLAALSAAKKDVESQNRKLFSERQVSEDEALQVLIDFITSVQRRELNEKIVQLRTDSVRIARERFQKGLLPMQDVDKAAIDLDNARATLTDSEVREDDTRAKLKTYLGHDNVATDWPWRDSIVRGQPLEAEEFRLESRPDWQSLSTLLEEERLKKRQAFGGFLPTLDFRASYGDADLSNLNRRDWQTVLTLSIPFFSGLRDYGAYQLEVVAEQEAAIRLESLKRSAPAETDSLKKSHKAARESAIAREKTSQITEHLYEDNLQRFRLGRATVNELNLDQDRLIQSQLLAVDGWSAVHLSYERLCHALGGFITAVGSCERTPP